MKYVYLLLILTLALKTYSQNPANGITKLKNKNYISAEKNFEKCIKSNKKISIAQYGMSLLYEDTMFYNYDISNAVLYNYNSISIFFLLSKKNKMKFEKIINEEDLIKRQYDLEYKWLEMSKMSKSASKLNNFIKNTHYPILKSKAKSYIYNNYLQKTNNIDSLVFFYNNYELDNLDKQKFQDKILKLNFEKSKKINTIQSYDIFLQKYPFTPQSDTIKKLKFVLYFETIKKQNTIDLYDEFLQNYPNTKEANEILLLKNDILLNNGIQNFIFPTPQYYLPASYLMPNYPRNYRNGVHEGIDFFANSTIPIKAVFDGIIIRIDTLYHEISAQKYDSLIIETYQNVNEAEILDFLRGRQVWIQHSDSIITRYCHLSNVNNNLKIGDFVQQGQIIGFGGSTGLQYAKVKNPNVNFGEHLHFEIRIGESFLGEGLPFDEMKNLYKKAFNIY